MGSLSRILLLLPLTLTLSCSLDSPTDGGNETPVQDLVPIEVPLDETIPEVTELLGGLLGSARADPENGALRGRLAMAYEVNGFSDAAVASYRQAEALDQSEARWPYYQALILASLGQQQEALQALERSIDMDPTHASTWMWLGTWSLDVGLLQEAEKAFKKAESLGLDAAKAGLARISLHRHRPHEALALLEPLSRSFGHPSVFQLLGRAYREAGRIDDARIAFSRSRSAEALRWKDDWQERKSAYKVGYHARAANAQRLLKLELVSEAKEALELLHEERPDNESVINTLSSAYWQDGERQKAFAILERALQRPPVHFTIHLNIAPFYFDLGEPEKALAHLDRAIELNPTAALPFVKRGLMLQKQRRFEEALGAFESALARNANDPLIFFYAGDNAAMLERWPLAVRRFEESVKIDPAFTLGHLNLALAFAKFGRLAEARDALGRAEKLGARQTDIQRISKHLSELETSSE